MDKAIKVIKTHILPRSNRKGAAGLGMQRKSQSIYTSSGLQDHVNRHRSRKTFTGGHAAGFNRSATNSEFPSRCTTSQGMKGNKYVS